MKNEYKLIKDSSNNIIYVEVYIESPKYGHQICLIDYETLLSLNKLKVRLLISCHGKCYAVFRVKRIRYFVHSYIMKTPKGMQTDHINGNSLDNRKANLRIVTTSTNIRSRNSLKNKKLSYIGVGINKSKSFTARITFKKIQYKIGIYLTAIEASLAYNRVNNIIISRDGNIPVDEFKQIIKKEQTVARLFGFDIYPKTLTAIETLNGLAL